MSNDRKNNYIMQVANLLIIAVAALIIIGIGVAIFMAGIVSASPGEVKVISGRRGIRVLQGKTGWRVPFIERVDSMTASMVSIDVKTNGSTPTNDFINVQAEAEVKVRIGLDRKELFEVAARNFLGRTDIEIADSVRETLEGHLRSIIGEMELKAIVQDRQQLANKVQENATNDLEEMGLEIVAFNIQTVRDDKGVIDNLGADNTEKIRQEAATAKAIATQKIEEQQASSEKLANDARVAADKEIAKRQNELEISKSQLKAEAEKERAIAEAAFETEFENQRSRTEAARANANIVRQEKEAQVKAKEVEVRKQTLVAEVEETANTERRAREQRAQAELFESMKKSEAEAYRRQQEAEVLKMTAEAEAYRRQQEAEALKMTAEAEADAIRLRGEAEAEAVRLKLEAEADGLDKKAEAMLKMKDAAVIEMLVNVLPEVARAVSEPLNNIDSITMYGEGNTGQMVGDIMTSMDKVTAGLGLDVRDLIQATVTGRAIGSGINNATKGAKKEAEPVLEPLNLGDLEDDGEL